MTIIPSRDLFIYSRDHSILSKFRVALDHQIATSLQAEVFYLPTLATLVSSIPELSDLYIERYLRTNIADAGRGIVSSNMMVAQGMALDDMFYAVNLETTDYALYTANPKIINRIGASELFRRDKIYDENIDGYVSALRLDVKTIDPNTVDVKGVSLRTRARKLQLNKYIFIPYPVINRLMMGLFDKFKSRKAFEITQGLPSGETKTRVFTTNKGLLTKLNGNENFSDSLKVQVFPLNGCLYAPVAGAADTTLGLSRIDFLFIDSIKTLTAQQVIQKVPRANSDAIAWEFKRARITQFAKKHPEQEDFVYLLRQFDVPIPDVFIDSNADLTKSYLRDLSRKGYFSMMTGLRELPEPVFNDLWGKFCEIDTEAEETIEKLRPYISNFQSIDPVKVHEAHTNENIRRKLYAMTRSKVIRFVGVSKGGRFYTKMGTNNHKILSLVYGPDYIKEYESLNFRTDLYYKLKREGLSESEIFDITGPITKEERESVSKSSTKYPNISIRTLFAADSEDYYDFIYPRGVYSLAVLG